MANPLTGVDVDRWYLVLIVCGMIALIAAIAAKEPLYAGLALRGVVFGLGELTQHPRQITLYPGIKVMSRERRTSLFGLTVDAIGVLLIAWFGYRLAIAA